MHKEAISTSTECVLAKITGQIGSGFYLAGGTALAIRTMHDLLDEARVSFLRYAYPLFFSVGRIRGVKTRG